MKIICIKNVKDRHMEIGSNMGTESTYMHMVHSSRLTSRTGGGEEKRLHADVTGRYIVRYY